MHMNKFKYIHISFTSNKYVRNMMFFDDCFLSIALIRYNKETSLLESEGCFNINKIMINQPQLLFTLNLSVGRLILIKSTFIPEYINK